jgi:hypothetical protein
MQVSTCAGFVEAFIAIYIIKIIIIIINQLKIIMPARGLVEAFITMVIHVAAGEKKSDQVQLLARGHEYLAFSSLVEAFIATVIHVAAREKEQVQCAPDRPLVRCRSQGSSCIHYENLAFFSLAQYRGGKKRV